MTITPRGESFLPSFFIDELKNLYQKEVDPKAKIRLFAAILRKKGRILEEVSFTAKHPGARSTNTSVGFVRLSFNNM